MQIIVSYSPIGTFRHLGFQTVFVVDHSEQACFSSLLLKETGEDTESILTTPEHSWTVRNVAVRTAEMFLIEKSIVKLGLLANSLGMG